LRSKWAAGNVDKASRFAVSSRSKAGTLCLHRCRPNFIATPAAASWLFFHVARSLRIDLDTLGKDFDEQANQTPYNQIAGQSVERLAAVSDGIFAVAMTLLVLDLHGPARDLIHNERDLLHALSLMFPQFVTYLMSFLTLAIFWNGQQAQLNVFDRANRHLTWIHMGFLFAVSIMPFSTRLLAEFIEYRTALLLYWGNVLLLGFVLYCSWQYAYRAGLVRHDTSPQTCKAIVRRILGAQALYVVGAALCVINTYVSIVLIVLVQLNFAIAPRIRWLSRI
jgi:uncharacterized membrane protein